MKGQSLMELLVALGVSLVLLTVIVASIINGLDVGQRSTNQNKASSYATEGIEIIRQMRDSSWATFDTLSGSYCMASGCTALTSTGGTCGPAASCGINVENTFSRRVDITKDSPSCDNGPSNPRGTRVQVVVSWADSRCTAGTFCYRVPLVTCYSQLD